MANGRLADRTKAARGTTWVYEEERPMATYLATVQIGRYEIVDLDAEVPVTVALPSALRPRLDDAFGRQADMVAFFGKTFGEYPFAGYTVVITEDELEIPLESQGLSTFGSNFLRPDWDAVRLVAHELSHQWFGNSLTLGGVEGHLAARGLRLLRGVAVVGGVRERRAVTSERSSTGSDSTGLEQDVGARPTRARS